MIDFKKEISKYQTLTELENAEQSVNEDDIKDIMKILEELTKSKKSIDKE